MFTIFGKIDYYLVQITFNKMKIAVLIPSHIYYDDQIERLGRCLHSIYSQTIVPDIFVSISFDNDIYKNNFSKILRKYPLVKYKISSEQKFQMEHIMILSKFICDYDMIMFCDDDDTYLRFRVEEFAKAFEQTKEYCIKNNIQLGGVREIPHITKTNDYQEYWAYGIPPVLLTEFFKRINNYKDLLRYKFADMYLRTYLRKTGGSSIIFSGILPDISGLNMYEYTIDNANSICGRHTRQEKTRENANSIIKDNITLALICDSDDLVNKSMKDASAPLSRLNEVVPEAERIKKLTAMLYI